jgi:hypothetical protein
MTHPYASEAYARSLLHWGEAMPVPEWGTSVIVRDIPAGGKDASGTYPIAVLAADADIPSGLDRLKRRGLVSVTLVVDEFHGPTIEALRSHFTIVRPFKTHFVRLMSKSFVYSKHHRYEVKRALSKVTIEPIDLNQHLSQWRDLYHSLVRRHGLTGLHDFAPKYFSMLSEMHGVTTIGAWLQDTLVSAHIWVDDGRRVLSHLAASSEDGYRCGAAYAVYDQSIRHFAEADVVILGGGSGTRDDPDDGLARFKRGFANNQASAYICGAILDPARYLEITQQQSPSPTSPFFPSYRSPKV